MYVIDNKNDCCLGYHANRTHVKTKSKFTRNESIYLLLTETADAAAVVVSEYSLALSASENIPVPYINRSASMIDEQLTTLVN